MNNNVEIISGQDAREKILNGARILTEAVASTLGPMGKNVVIEHLGQYIPQVTKDGVTVAKKIKLADKYENMGCQLVKQAAVKTAIEAGDGTTSSTILSYNLMRSIEAAIKDKKYNVHTLRHELEVGKEKLLSLLKEISIPVENNDQIYHVAKISANNDERIGRLIADAYKIIGHNGIITVEPSNTTQTSIETVKGIKFNTGWNHYYFVNNQAKTTFEAQNCAVFITDKKITSGNEILSYVLSRCRKFTNNLLIIAENIEGEAFSTLVANTRNKSMNICLVRPPFFGLRRREYLNDISKMIGTTPIFEDDPTYKLQDINGTHFGIVNSVIVDKESTILQGFSTDTKEIENYCLNLKELKDQETDFSQKEWLSSRIATLSSGVAVIKLGGNSETEIYETKDRLDDALAAVKSSLEEGIVCGGGSTYIRLSQCLDENILGEHLLKSVLSSITKTILNNGDYDQSVISMIINYIKYGREINSPEELEELEIDVNATYGYNAKEEKYTSNMIKDGIIDPTKVIRNSISNSISVACMYTITNYAISTIEDDII